MQYYKIIDIDDIVNKVFNLEGFLTNYNSNPNYFSTTPCNHIGRVNPFSLLNRVKKYNYFYDNRLLHQLIKTNVNISSNKYIIFDDLQNKVIESSEELKNYLLNNKNFEYVEYAK